MGKGAFANAQDGDATSIFIGYNCGHNANALSQNTAVGTQSLQESHSSNNCAFGFQALLNNTTGSGHNTALGHKALFNLTVADTNTAVGASALYSNVTGDRNVAVGYEALYSFQLGADSFNSALGYQAGRAMTTGYFNTVLGGEAGKSITTAINNTCVGTSAGNGSITVYSNNTCLGYNAQTATNAGNSVTLGDSNISSLRCNTTSISSLSDVRDKTEIV